MGDRHNDPQRVDFDREIPVSQAQPMVHRPRHGRSHV